MPQDDATWLNKSPALREKLVAVGLIEPEPIPEKLVIPTLEAFLDGYIERQGASRKPATVAVWKQVVANLKEFMPEGIRINQITAGHAKEFHEKLKAKGMATTTIHKRIQFARQFMHDAVDWKIIDENPFCKVKTQKSSVKVNEFVPREVVDKLMKKANPVWQVILGLSRYGGLRTPSETLSLRWEDIDWELNRMSIPEPKVEHHEGRGIRSCPIFPELRPILDEAFEIFGDKSDYVVAAPQYRAAANTAMGWKNANLRSEMTRLLRRAGVSGWPRLFHSMRASRQTELQREFPLHVVCSWLGNSPRIAQQSYLLVTEDDFAKAAGVHRLVLPSSSSESKESIKSNESPRKCPVESITMSCGIWSTLKCLGIDPPTERPSNTWRHLISSSLLVLANASASKSKLTNNTSTRPAGNPSILFLTSGIRAMQGPQFVAQK
jgi:integrase